MEPPDSTTPNYNTTGQMPTENANFQTSGKVKPKCYLLSIPLELRDKIYRYILVTDKPLKEWNGSSLLSDMRAYQESLSNTTEADKKKSCGYDDHTATRMEALFRRGDGDVIYSMFLDTRVLQTNKQVYEEAIDTMYKGNTFRFHLGSTRQHAIERAPKIKVLAWASQRDLSSIVANHRGGLRRLVIYVATGSCSCAEAWALLEPLRCSPAIARVRLQLIYTRRNKPEQEVIFNKKIKILEKVMMGMMEPEELD